jgi:hypothetical protein
VQGSGPPIRDPGRGTGFRMSNRGLSIEETIL